MKLNVDQMLFRMCFLLTLNTCIFINFTGKYTNHKGRNRKFTSPEELEEQRKQEEQKQKQVVYKL